MSSDALIDSAVTFLQDPKVADAPLAKRVAFLESKGLSQEQIDLALQRAKQQALPGEQTPSDEPALSSSAQVPPPIPYASYQQQQLPPALPQRDWRDWFIMAVMSGGFSWAAYALVKRYVLPLVQPPTPSQLESDKDLVKAQFDQVQDMLNILQTDNASIKQIASDQNVKIEATLSSMEGVIKDMKDKTTRREVDIRQLGLEIDQIKELIPKAIDSVKTKQTESLNDLNSELRSLKLLLQNKIKAGPGSSTEASTSNSTQSAATASTTANDPLARFSSRGASPAGIPAWQLPASSATTEETPSK